MFHDIWLTPQQQQSVRYTRYTSLKKRERERQRARGGEGERDRERDIRFVTQSMLSVRLDLNPEISGTFPRLCCSIWLLLGKKGVCYIYKTMNDNYDAQIFR